MIEVQESVTPLTSPSPSKRALRNSRSFSFAGNIQVGLGHYVLEDCQSESSNELCSLSRKTEVTTEKSITRCRSVSKFDECKLRDHRDAASVFNPALRLRSDRKFRLVDAVYGPPLDDDLPEAFAGYLLLELSRCVVPQVSSLLAKGGEWHIFGSLNSLFGDPSPMITKELRIAVAHPVTAEIRVATFSEFADMYIPDLEFLWKQSPPIREYLGLMKSAQPIVQQRLKAGPPQHSDDLGDDAKGVCHDGNRHRRIKAILPSHPQESEIICELILSFVVEYLGFLERVHCSTVSRIWNTVFHSSGACSSGQQMVPHANRAFYFYLWLTDDDCMLDITH